MLLIAGISLAAMWLAINAWFMWASGLFRAVINDLRHPNLQDRSAPHQDDEATAVNGRLVKTRGEDSDATHSR